MTRARALKTVIRARVAKTGERYTTARRHVLKALQARTGSPAPHEDSSSTATLVASPTAAVSVKGAVSDAKCRDKTGHNLAHWFDVLDRFGAVQKGHAAAARHLRDAHGIDSWYSQGITVAYERTRGLRAPNQRRDGEYEFSASKVVAADTKTVMAALVEKRRRARWVDGVDPDLIGALSAALGAAGSKGFIVKADGQARYRYTWDGTTVEVYVTPKPGGKSSIVVQHIKLPSPDVVEERRTQWRTTLTALAAYLAG